MNLLGGVVVDGNYNPRFKFLVIFKVVRSNLNFYLAPEPFYRVKLII